MIEIRPLSLDDIPAIEKIHSLSFPDSALTALGEGSLQRYYRWLITGPHDTLLLGIWDDNQLAGFSFGGVFRGALSGFIKKNKWYLIGQVLSHPWIVFKFHDAINISLTILRIRRYRKPKASTNIPSPPQKRVPSFGILAIAVNPQQQGKGLGQMMMERSEEFAIEKKFERMNLTVHPENTQAVGFYTKLGWKKWNDDGNWQGKMIKNL